MTHRNRDSVHPSTSPASTPASTPVSTPGRRSEILRNVVEIANARRDGVLPLDVPGATEVFGDAHGLVTALQLRWHNRLAGRLEQELTEEPSDLEGAVLRGWAAAATELAGVRAVLDEATARPDSTETEHALTVAAHKEWALLATLAGRRAVTTDGTLQVGRELEDRARALAAARDLSAPVAEQDTGATARPGSLIGRLRAHLAA